MLRNLLCIKQSRRCADCGCRGHAGSWYYVDELGHLIAGGRRWPDNPLARDITRDTGSCPRCDGQAFTPVGDNVFHAVIRSHGYNNDETDACPEKIRLLLRSANRLKTQVLMEPLLSAVDAMGVQELPESIAECIVGYLPPPYIDVQETSPGRGCTPLMTAVNYAFCKVLSPSEPKKIKACKVACLLIEAGADTSITNGDGYTALDLICRYGSNGYWSPMVPTVTGARPINSLCAQLRDYLALCKRCLDSPGRGVPRLPSALRWLIRPVAEK